MTHKNVVPVVLGMYGKGVFEPHTLSSPSFSLSRTYRDFFMARKVKALWKVEIARHKLKKFPYFLVF